MDDSRLHLPGCGKCGGGVHVFASSGRPRLFCFGCQPKPEARTRKPYTPKVSIQKRCEARSCGALFVATFDRQKYCSGECRHGTNNTGAQEARRDRSERACAGCSISFTPAYGDPRQKYCSVGCRLTQKYRQSAGSTHRRRTKKYGGQYVHFKKAGVFERDGWLCKLCGVQTPKEKQGTRAHDAPELDHIVALAGGGDHSIENTQCLCRSCNLLKGTRSMAQLTSWLAV